MSIPADVIVFGASVEIIERANVNGAAVGIGYGDYANYWGFFQIGTRTTETAAIKSDGAEASFAPAFTYPIEFSTATKLLVTLKGAPTKGRIKILVYVLKNDRT
jgi:hypothetical protein